MPITPFLRHEAFQPEHIDEMSDAFTRACAALGLVDRADPITALVARHIIDVAQTGVHASEALYLSTMSEFKPPAR